MIVDTVRAGHAVLEWVTLRAGPVELEVSADVLRIGDESDSVRVPVSAVTQQRVADLLDCVLPTPKIADLIWDQADVRLTPHAQNVEDFTPGAYLVQHLAVEQELAGRRGLIACPGKDWTLCRQALADAAHAANYGWHVATTRELARFGGLVESSRRCVTWAPDHRLWVVQPLASRHEPNHEDYSQKARLVRRACLVGGAPSTIDAVLKDPLLARHISHEGVLADSRLPRVARAGSAGVVVVAPLPGAVVEPSVLRPGDQGEPVKEWQRIVGVAPDSAGTFGPKTEAATRAWQTTHGLLVTGAVSAGQLRIGRLEAGRPAAPPAAMGAGADFWIPAKHFTAASRASIQWAVLHSTENDIQPGMARAVAKFFASQGATGPQSSAHYVIDADEVVQCVEEAAVAWAAPGANALGLQFELVGRGGPKRDRAGKVIGPATDWLAEGLPVVERAAVFIARACARWSIPLVPLLDPEDLLLNEPAGITLHSVVTDASRLALQRGLRSSRFFPKNAAQPPTHQDPGGNNGSAWPMAEFMALVAASAA